MSRGVRILNYVGIAFNSTAVIAAMIPPYKWFDLISIFHVAAIVFLVLAIKTDRQNRARQAKLELDRNLSMLQTCWIEGIDDDDLDTWFLADTKL